MAPPRSVCPADRPCDIRVRTYSPPRTSAPLCSWIGRVPRHTTIRKRRDRPQRNPRLRPAANGFHQGENSMTNGSGIVVTETYLDGIVLSDPPTDDLATLASTGYVIKSNCGPRLRRHLRRARILVDRRQPWCNPRRGTKDHVPQPTPPRRLQRQLPLLLLLSGAGVHLTARAAAGYGKCCLPVQIWKSIGAG